MSNKQNTAHDNSIRTKSKRAGFEKRISDLAASLRLSIITIAELPIIYANIRV